MAQVEVEDLARKFQYLQEQRIKAFKELGKFINYCLLEFFLLKKNPKALICDFLIMFAC